jgi:exopolysaccharide biosynthesis polyprenyl glycosylphosphotransferase
MRSARKPRQVFILIVDIGIFFLALFLALFVRYGAPPSPDQWWILCRSFLVSWILWIAVFYTANLYNIDSSFDDLRFAGKLFTVVAVNALLSALVFYLGDMPKNPKTILFLYSGFLLILLWLWRFAYGRVSRLYLPRRATAFAGLDASAAEIVHAIDTDDHLGYEAVAFLDETGRAPEAFRGRACHDRMEFVRAIIERGVSLVVVAEESRLSVRTRRAFLELIDKPVRFIRLPDFYEQYLRKIPINAINDLWFLENIDLGGKRRYGVLKRGLDIALSLILLILILVPCLFISLAVKISSPGPVLFRQERLGKGESLIQILKFRTMRTERNDFSPTAKNDPRVTGLGRILRALRLDELPQIVNILVGEMSFIGPRPERPELAVELEKAIPYYRQRLMVKPGITGWDQVSGEYHSPSVEDVYKKLQYDLYYVKNMSFLLDASIFFKTIMTVLGRKGR